jgi:Cys-tRNA(Pro) deacylase
LITLGGAVNPGRNEAIMVKDRTPVTPCILVLRKHEVSFHLHAYRYEDRGGTNASARELGVDEHLIIKTLVMEDEGKTPLIVLMHGDRQVSTKILARALSVKSVAPCDPKVAERHTGYRVGGTSPFGTRKPLRTYMEASIAPLPRIFINAGSRGLLAEIAAADLIRVLNPTTVTVAL